MLKSYLTIAWRSLLKNRWHSLMNITGLAISMASFVVILLYLNYELSYDKWDASLQRVFKVSLRSDGDILEGTPALLSEFIANNYPNAEAATAIMPGGDFEALLASDDKRIYQKGIVFVDASFLDIFPYRLAMGNASTALKAPNAGIISEDLSLKLFGKVNPIGKTVKIYNSIECLITGVLKKPGGPSHLNVEMIFRDPGSNQNRHWENYSFQTYIKTKQPVSEQEVEDKINGMYYEARVKKNNQSLKEYKKAGNQTGLITDSVQDLHNFPKHGESNFNITIVLFVLAVFLLIAGAINFSNLSLAKAINRAKEVGIRKVLGSKRGHIILQSLLEIALQCAISLLLAGLLVIVALPYFNSNFDLPLSLFSNQDIVSIALQIAASLLVIILFAGLYPALFLSHYQTAQVLKGNYNKGSKGVFFRNSLLVVQLTLSALFVTGIIVINRQMDFMQSKDLGFNPSQVIRIEATQKSREKNFPLVHQALLSIAGVEYAAKSTAVPGSKVIDTSTNAFRYGGKSIRLNSVKASVDFFKTMNIGLLQGRLFADDRPEDLNNTAIINETALKQMGTADPVGQSIYFPYCDSIPYTIVGVVKDFNVQGLENDIRPTIYTTSNAHCFFQSGGAILVKIKTVAVQQTLAGIEGAWKKIEPGFPIRYSFLDEDFRRLLTGYMRLGKIMLLFTIISVLIASTGLFALTSFLAQQRTKEIGIRKVLGASVQNITALLSKDFIKIVIIAILISMPAAWWALDQWLQDFAYKITLHWWMFALAALLTVCVTLITVSFQAIKAAIANPVKSLRTE